MTPLEERFTIVHLNNVKDYLNDAFKELSKVTQPISSMHSIRLNIVKTIDAVNTQINKLKEPKKK